MAVRGKKDLKIFQDPELQLSRVLSTRVSVPFWFSDTKGRDGEWIVLIHGLGVDCSVWIPYLKDLTRDYNLILIDLPGHGNNASRYSLEECSRMIRNTLSQFDAKASILVGHCIGGCVAQAFASAYPELCRELILIDTFPLGGEQYHYASFRWLTAVSPLMAAVPSPVFSGALTGLFSGSRSGRKALYPQIREQKVLSVFKVFKNTMQAMSKLATPTYHFPVHYMVGTRDPLAPIKKWNQQAAELHRGTYTELNGCGHYSVTDDPQLVLSEIRKALPQE